MIKLIPVFLFSLAFTVFSQERSPEVKQNRCNEHASVTAKKRAIKNPNHFTSVMTKEEQYVKVECRILFDKMSILIKNLRTLSMEEQLKIDKEIQKFISTNEINIPKSRSFVKSDREKIKVLSIKYFDECLKIYDFATNDLKLK